MVCPYLTGLWTFRCLARDDFVIPTITEETRYCLSKQYERCPHYPRRKGKGKRSRAQGTDARPDVNKRVQP